MIKLKDLLESSESEKTVDDLLKIGNYTAFVKKLQSVINDQEVMGLLDSGTLDGSANDEKVSISKSSLKVKNGIPTQSEIDIDKSLSWQLNGKGQTQAIMAGGTITIAGPIITLNNKYILDGHHRWSQAYCFNPESNITSINLSGIKDWKTALKAMQIAIGVEIGKIPINVVNGKNLLKMGSSHIVKYVEKHIQPKPLQDMVNSDVFRTWAKQNNHILNVEDMATNKNLAGAFVANNVKTMQSRSKPPSGVSNRGFMPQTGDAPGFAAKLASGDVNFLQPVTMNEGKYPEGGDCFMANAKEFLNEYYTKRGARLVHGEVQMQNTYPAVTFGHCFIVDGSRVIDVSNGREIKISKKLYYILGHINEIDNTYEYTYEEVNEMILKYKHWGPWELKTKM